MDRTCGTFERVADGNINKVVAGSFQYVDSNPQTPWDMMQAIYQGFVNSSSTIFMIFFCGSAIALLEESKALSTAFSVMARMLKGKEFIVIGVTMFALGLGNSAGVFANLALQSSQLVFFCLNQWVGTHFLDS